MPRWKRDDGCENRMIVDTDPAGGALWRGSCSRWTAWNHVRALCATAAAVALSLIG